MSGDLSVVFWDVCPQKLNMTPQFLCVKVLLNTASWICQPELFLHLCLGEKNDVRLETFSISLEKHNDLLYLGFALNVVTLERGLL